MKKKVLLLTASAGITAIALASGVTLALFTSAAAPSVNNITAGRLCIRAERDAFDTVPGPMFYMTAAQGFTGSQPGRYPMAELSPNSPPGYMPPTPGGWAPGDQVTRTLTIYNGGDSCGTSIAARLTHITATLHAGSYGPLADKMLVTVRAQMPGGGMAQVGQAYLSQFLAPGSVTIAYPGGAQPEMPQDTGMTNLQMEFQVNFDLNTPNAYQGKDMVVDFKVHAEQVANNP